jgi:phosphohistidine swiveling domain-containing protein
METTTETQAPFTKARMSPSPSLRGSGAGHAHIAPLSLATDATRFGGKAAHLARLVAAGHPVPAGFALTHDADAGAAETLAALRSHLAQLGDVALAVRSSAVDEDGADAAFAGIYESVLDVRGEAAVLAAIAQVRASASSLRALAYRESGSAAQMGIVVQQLVQPEAAGVLFTADPLTGERETCVVSAVPGLGESLVSGEDNGEEWVVQGTQVARRRQLERAVLSEAQVRALATLGERVAREAGTPQDIEWVLASGQISLVQARPMTALPERVAWEPPHRGGTWTRTFRWGEWLPDPVSPLFATWFLPRTQPTFVEGSLRILGAKITGPIHSVVNGWYFHSGSGTRNALAMVPGILWRRFRFMRAVMTTASDPVAAEPLAAAPSRRFYEEDLLPRYQALAREVVPDEPGAQIDYIDRVCDVHGELMLSMTLVAGFAWKVESAVARFFRKHLRDVEGAPHELVSGLAPVPPPGAHLCCSLDWMHPTAGELGLAGGEPFVHAGAAARREALEQACMAQLSPQLQARFQAMLAVARDYALVREQQSRDLTLAWPNVRAILRRLGARAVQAGAFDAPDDVFWVERGELEEALSGRSLRRRIAERRARWQRQRRLIPPLSVGVMPGFIGKMFSDFERDLRGGTHDDADAAIKGAPASAGRATGAVRIVRTPADFDKLQAGEVLVATATAPAWTPLFARAAAVVTDAGSVAAHASLVAREYGVPAVVGTRDATARLADGDLVLVDGSLGRVELLRKAAEQHGD